MIYSKKYYTNWTSVKGADLYRPENGVYVQWRAPTVTKSLEMKEWCDNLENKTRYHIQPYVGDWWFENAQDALMFKLTFL